MIMKLEKITEGLKSLLLECHYNPATILFYEREWNKVRLFLMEEYGNTEFEMERGLMYLDRKYGFVSKCNDGTLSQQRAQLLRTIHMLEECSLHGVLTRRHYASKNPIVLNDCCSSVLAGYSSSLEASELSASTKERYIRSATVFMDCLSQSKALSVGDVSIEDCNAYLRTLTGYSFKTVEQNVCGLRHFLRRLRSSGMIQGDYAEKIHMPPVPKGSGIPSVWDEGELRPMIAAIDRDSPIGKRDYAMIAIASVLGLRAGDIKSLRHGNFDWESKKISIVQHKTGKPLALPIPDAVGWAVIECIRNGRPSCFETDIVFLKHRPPFDPIGGCLYQLKCPPLNRFNIPPLSLD